MLLEISREGGFYLNTLPIKIKDFDDRLAKLGHHASGGNSKRNHHKQAVPTAPPPKGKA